MILIAMALGAAQPVPPPQSAERDAARDASETRTRRLIELQETVRSLAEAEADSRPDAGPSGL